MKTTGKEGDIHNVIPGQRVRLIKMPNDPRPIMPGETGTVASVDDIGTIHVNWDSGRLLGLVPGEDLYEII